MPSQKTNYSANKQGKCSRIKSSLRRNHFLQLTGLFMGFVSTIWFLIRVIPKPTRATYPCMRVAGPLASGFVVYIIGIFTSVFALRKAKAHFHRSRYFLSAAFVFIAMVAVLWTLTTTDKPALAEFSVQPQIPNNPMGEAVGIHPGRVVWVHDPDATNENCTIQIGDGWFLDKNNDMSAIDKMVSAAVKQLTGETTDSLAWDALFRDFNEKKGEISGYEPGEKIFLKLNITSAWGFGEQYGNIRSSDYSKSENKYYNVVETSPQVTLAFLRQLINEYSVRQEDVYVGDPMKHIYKHYWDLWHPEFPNVKYIDHDAKLGRTQVYKSSTPLIYYSDRGTVLQYSNDRLYTVIEEADYMINIASLKAHEFAGITLCAKNHFGSQTRDSARHLHPGPVRTSRNSPLRDQMGMYRVQVDIMGHRLLGGNTMLFVVDGLWSAPQELSNPVKWKMSPFNNDFPSSIFISQDQVALESVCFDFLRSEFTVGSDTWPQMGGVDDYLHQAADPTKWPEGIVYDPENDGTPLTSLGVHEHWNNRQEKQYTRNLGTGDGIELVYLNTNTTVVSEDKSSIAIDDFALYPNFPNPFNPSTTIRYQLSHPSRVRLDIYNIQGQKVKTLVDENQPVNLYTVLWNGRQDNASQAASGVYIYNLVVSGKSGTWSQSRKMILAK